ncbi:CinA family protein [Rivibacter subsaxonicus]|uniref:Nicotinamide-nucleotide amidase n=1 Tax=Rivibacter subsaxonicus TaxID=457575 RepID=A0A4Q7VW48_9BURK|nr:CinA family protein [Rivibacter subsaxonicus]RZU00668.1 nicotinamide-nucleotide amidase [Rivibacter subsaxonicus]
MNGDDEALVLRLADTLRAKGLRVASAESCTGGLIAAACTSIAGSSDWFERGFVSYSNAAKSELLGVDARLIAAEGAVSEPVALAMAEGALIHSPADLVVAVTGIAGPGGGSASKPVGLVWLAIARRGLQPRAERLQLKGDRAAVRAQTVRIALERLLRAAEAA